MPHKRSTSVASELVSRRLIPLNRYLIERFCRPDALYKHMVTQFLPHTKI